MCLKLNMKKILDNIIIISFNIIFYPFLIFSIKSKNTLVFGERLGQTYKDNSRFLYEYSIKNKKNYKSIWITDNQKIYKKLKKRDETVLYRDSLKALYYILISKYIFITVDFKDVSRKIKLFNRLNIVQLWHGTQLKKSVVDIGREKYNYHTIASKEFINRKTSISPKIKKILTGYPRNDVLKPVKKKKDFIIGYFPTYTKQFNFLVKPTEQEDLKILQLKKKYNYKFMISLHPSQNSYKIFKNKINSFKVLHSNPTFNTYKFLNNVDILITDISSIFFDYLLLDRPIIFLIKDKKFTKKIPVRYDFDKILPGPTVNNWNSVVEEIIKIQNKKDSFKHKRNIICKKFNYYSDAKNSERIFSNLNI